MARTERSKIFGWRCQACGKSLTAKPVAGKVIVHTASNGALCPGSGKAAASLISFRKPTKSQAIGGRVAASKKKAKAHNRSEARKSVDERERPEVLPVKIAAEAHKVPKDRMTGGNDWSFFQDSPRQDLETDAGWRRVRLGPSQGTGKRR